VLIAQDVDKRQPPRAVSEITASRHCDYGLQRRNAPSRESAHLSTLNRAQRGNEID